MVKRFRVCCGSHHSILYKKSLKDQFVTGSNNYGQLELSDNLDRYNFVKFSLSYPVIAMVRILLWFLLIITLSLDVVIIALDNLDWITNTI